jgi:hypothetical protein
LDDLFNEKFDAAKEALEKNMPQVPVKAKKSRPKKPFKGNGELSEVGKKWKKFSEEHGKDFDYMGKIEYVKGYKDPNAGSSQQLKNWLFDMGWHPETYEFKRDKETGDVRKIPQIKDKNTGELCKSIERMISKEPALEHLREMSVVKHRMVITSTFLKNVDNNGYVKALVQGFTNTLRFKHKVCLNLPSTRKPYGKEIRGLLQARNESYELCGSDMSSLEDRTKQHYMWEYDPEYVKEMQADDFDPHCDIALEAGIMSAEQVQAYKGKDWTVWTESSLSLLRHGGKSTNYAATYGAGGETIARSANVPEAMGNKLHEAYWSRNWSLKAIADNCVVKQSRKLKWLWNPVAKLWIYLKTDKDRFSTLNQSTGTYCFDLWIQEVIKRRRQLTGQFHDEGIWELAKGNRESMTKVLKDSIQAVNERLQLNRDLDCDVQFHKTYAGIH